MTTVLEIFEGNVSDLDSIMVVMENAFDPKYGEAWTASQCTGAIGLPGCRLFIARQSNNVVGFALIRCVFEEAELLLIAISPNFQRLGVGSVLVKHIVGCVRTTGVQTLFLEVRANNTAVSFYQRLGFERTGIRPNYYKGNGGYFFDAITLGYKFP